MKMFGLIGETLGHSYSPWIHRKIYEKMNWSAEYGLFQMSLEKLPNLVSSLTNLGISGVNVTIPYKVSVMPYLDELTAAAERIGAVNTITLSGNQSLGDNTDYYGIQKTFERMHFSPKGKTAIVLGNGGASKAVQAVLQNEGVSFQVLSIEDDGNPTIDELASFGKHDLLVHATPVGMYPKGEESIISKELLSGFQYVFDVVYNPDPTKLVREAREIGLQAETGLAMLVYQAIRSEEIWFNSSIPDQVAEEIISELLSYILGGNQ